MLCVLSMSSLALWLICQCGILHLKPVLGVKAWCNLQVKLCDPCLRVLCVLRTWHYINACIYPLVTAVLRDSVLTVLLYSLHLCQMMNKAVFIVYLLFWWLVAIYREAKQHVGPRCFLGSIVDFGRIVSAKCNATATRVSVVVDKVLVCFALEHQCWMRGGGRLVMLSGVCRRL